ncbi:MAG TPA: hypothetical protein DD624_06670 [Alphaproteobacteria bacterium]|nr:hypothetical protein [Alphaproteobacteria bacterium]
MSLFGALKTGVTGLTAQSSAMSIISDNIANVNTVGYKAGSASFSTLVTKQTSSTAYSSGGVQCRNRTGIDAQGLLSGTTRSTDLAISGNGFFVTTSTSNPGAEDLYSYTRAGSFEVDENGYLRNANGAYLQAWPLQAFDGSENASLVKIGENMYMKAYSDETGSTVYVNDNVIDSKNMKSINLNTIGGTAQETKNIRFGANLPSDAPVYDPAKPEDGGRYSSAVLVYDSLGNSHNVTMTFTKVESGAWSIDLEMPSGAATLVTYSQSEVVNDATPDVYSARAQLEFTSIPTNHSTIAMETNGTNYVFEFTTDGTTTYSPKANEKVIAVDISSGVVTTADAVDKFNKAIQANMPSAGRFTVSSDGKSIQVEQSNSGAAVKFNAGKCKAVLQSIANPDPETNIATGEFELPEIDWDIKNTARVDFVSDKPADYLNKSVTIGTNTYVFSDTDAAKSEGVVTVNISSAIDKKTGTVSTVKLVQLLKAKINDNEPDYTRYVASGSTLEINPTSTGANILVNSGNSTSVTFQNTNLAAYVGQTIRIGDKTNNLDVEFEFTDNTGIVSGTMLANGNIAVNIADLTDKDTTDALPIAVMNALYQTIQTYYDKHESIENLSNYFQVSGATLVSTGDYLATTATTKNTINVNQQTLTFRGTNAATYVGSTVGYNGETYTFSKFGTTTGTNIDITDAIQSQTLKLGTNPADGNTITIGGTTYTFKTTPAAANDVEIGADAKTTLANLCAAAGLVAGTGVSIVDDTLTLSNGKIVEIDAGTSGATLTELVSAEGVMTLFAEAIGKTDYQQGAQLTLTKYGANPFDGGTTTGAAQAGGVTTVAEAMISTASTTGIGAGLSIVGKNNGKQINQPENTGLLAITNTFSFNNVDGAQSGAKIAGVRFNADGTPKEINMGNVAIEWANGAKDMTGNYYESSQINLYIGDTNTANGLTQLAGKYTTNYTTQDGAKYGSYTGVSVSEDGIVTAIFDNGETRAIAQIPIATFVDANSLEALTGNIWIETTASGNATLRTAGEGGAGTISASSLEDSTVDIASEFTDMITTQRAYSAASKIITTADDMLEELLTIKR